MVLQLPVFIREPDDYHREPDYHRPVYHDDDYRQTTTRRPTYRPTYRPTKRPVYYDDYRPIRGRTVDGEDSSHEGESDKTAVASDDNDKGASSKGRVRFVDDDK